MPEATSNDPAINFDNLYASLAKVEASRDNSQTAESPQQKLYLCTMQNGTLSALSNEEIATQGAKRLSIKEIIQKANAAVAAVSLNSSPSRGASPSNEQFTDLSRIISRLQREQVAKSTTPGNRALKFLGYIISFLTVPLFGIGLLGIRHLKQQEQLLASNTKETGLLNRNTLLQSLRNSVVDLLRNPSSPTYLESFKSALLEVCRDCANVLPEINRGTADLTYSTIIQQVQAGPTSRTQALAKILRALQLTPADKAIIEAALVRRSGVDIQTLLENPICASILLEEAAKTYTSENIKFLIAVQDFRYGFNSRSFEDNQALMQDILANFVNPDASNQVNLPSELRVDLNNPTCTADVFNAAQGNIARLVQTNLKDSPSTIKEIRQLVA